MLGLYRALKDTAAAGDRLAQVAPDRVAPDRVAPDVEAVARFRAAMDDDFNTPEALAVLQGVAREINQAKAAGQGAGAAAAAVTLRYLGGILGVLQQDADAYLKRSALQGSLLDKDIDDMMAARQIARQNRNFAESDRIRDQLAAAGIMLEDKAGGKTEWRRA